MAIIICGIDMPKKHYIKGYYITDDGKVLDVSRKNVIGKAVQIPSGARLIDAKQLKNKVLKWLPPNPCGGYLCDVLWDDGGVTEEVEREELYKTGRHFPEIAELLKKMRDSDD